MQLAELGAIGHHHGYGLADGLGLLLAAGLLGVLAVVAARILGLVFLECKHTTCADDDQAEDGEDDEWPAFLGFGVGHEASRRHRERD